jgi:hypothetical protein
VERKIGTNPESLDTDGDGLLDATDPAPAAMQRTPRHERDVIAMAIIEQVFGLFTGNPETPGVVAVVYDAPLEWRGFRGPMITLSAKQYAEQHQRAEHGGLHLFVTPGCNDDEMLARHDPNYKNSCADLADNEREFKLTKHWAPLNAKGFDVVVRKIGETWFVKSLTFRWIS